MVCVAVALPLVTVTVYDPPLRELRELVVGPSPQAYENDPLPPEGVTLIAPSDPPYVETGVVEYEMVTEAPATVLDAVAVTPSASVMVAVYVFPADTEERFCVMSPVFQEYRTGAIPPDAVSVSALPETLVLVEMVSLLKAARSVEPSNELKRQNLLMYPAKGCELLKVFATYSLLQEAAGVVRVLVPTEVPSR
jgi:hypothetical protein